MLNENWKISTDSDHLFRHLTEVNGKDARGGYLEGSVWISRELLSAPLELKITLISSEFRSSSIKEHLAKLRIHPNLLYMTRFDEESVKSQRPRRQRELEARTPMWKIDLIIKDRRVSWFTESDAQPAGYQQPIGELVEAEGGGGILDLKMLHITVITPLQRTNATGIKIIDSLKFRRYMFEEVEDDEKWEKIVKEMEKFYAKEGKPELDRICLKFDLSWNGSNGVTLQSSLVSEHITNTKSKSMGAFDLSGEISISKTCCKLSRRVYIFSQFALPSGEKDKEVIPRFVVSPDNGGTFREDYRLKQPESFGVGKLWMWFETPLQAEDHVTDIYQENLKIYVEGYRLKDKYVTKKKIEFQYLHHMNEDDRCLCSIQHPDLLSSGPQTVEETLSARPGQKRRRLTQSSRSSGSVCKSPVSISSPANSERIQLQDENEDEPAPIDFDIASPFDNVDGTYDELEKIPTEDLLRIQPDATGYPRVETLTSDNFTAFLEEIPCNERFYAAGGRSPLFEFPNESELRNKYLPEIVTDSLKPLIPTSARVPKEPTGIQYNSKLQPINPLKCFSLYAFFPLFILLVYSQSSEFLGVLPLCRFFSLLAGLIRFFYLAMLPESHVQKAVKLFVVAIIYLSFNCLLDCVAP